MSQPERPTGSAPTAPEQRTCGKCNETKTVVPETWPYKKGRQGHYAPHGTTCLACEKKRKAEYEARRDKIAALVKDVPSSPLTSGAAGKSVQREAVATSKLDVAKALKAGSRVLNDYAPSILARVLEYAEDPDSPHHLWAVQLMAERILPRKLYEELGGAAAGIGSLQDKRPQFVIQVLPATPEAPEGRVVPGEHTVLAIEAKPE